MVNEYIQKEQHHHDICNLQCDKFKFPVAGNQLDFIIISVQIFFMETVSQKVAQGKRCLHNGSSRTKQWSVMWISVCLPFLVTLFLNSWGH